MVRVFLRLWLRRLRSLLMRVNRWIPRDIRVFLRRLVIRPRGGMFSAEPISELYGFDRGTPIDRAYIADFIGAWASEIRGRVLEVRDPEYTERFGGSEVARCDLLDIDPQNERATIVADLAEEGSLPHERFDCIILTQTLQYVSDMGAALRNVMSALAPGGVILASVPSLARIDPHAGPEGDLWRFTPGGLRHLLQTYCPGAEIEVWGYGNLATALAFLRGRAAEETRKKGLSHQDSDFPLIACGRVHKS